VIRRLRYDDSGSAILEFIFLAVVVLVPLIYLIASVATVQRSILGVREASREAGRAFATADSSAVAGARASAAVRLALANQGLPDDATVRFVDPSAPCDGPSIGASLTPGAEFAICVLRHAELPGVPTLVQGRGITTVGRYVVHVDDFRAAS
jgi:hypothetical protein